jgi:hypothetical protein
VLPKVPQALTGYQGKHRRVYLHADLEYKTCGVFSDAAVLITIAGANAQWFPFTFVFKAVLNAITVVYFIKVLGLHEHFFAVQQAGKSALTRLEAFILAVSTGLRVV